eukprot:1318761-Amorphochlora_amoeboformis.AAC.2
MTRSRVTGYPSWRQVPPKSYDPQTGRFIRAVAGGVGSPRCLGRSKRQNMILFGQREVARGAAGARNAYHRFKDFVKCGDVEARVYEPHEGAKGRSVEDAAHGAEVPLTRSGGQLRTLWADARVRTH